MTASGSYRRPSGIRKPPPELWAEMEAAGKSGDQVRLGLAKARYRAWLADNGIEETTAS